jgi:hypothetical protein
MPEVATMAKKKTSRAVSRPPKMTTRAVRMTETYAGWLERAAAFDRSSLSAFLDRAAAHYAKEIGFEDAPPERT